MSLRNYIKIFIFVIGLFLAQPSLAAYWVNNPSLCPTDAYSQSCVGGQKVCGVNGSNVVSCANTATFAAPVASTVNGTSVTANGGYMIDCYAQDASAPYCDNNGGSVSGLYYCFQKTACNNARVVTNCSAGVWETATCDTNTCLPGYRNCNADADCSDVNEHDGDSCTTAGNQPGTYSACVCNAISATLKLNYDSAIGTYLKNSTLSNPTLSIFSDGSLVIGSTTQPTTTKFSLHGSNLFINDSAITSGTPNAAITKSYLDSALSAYSSSNSLWQLSGNNLFASSTSWNVGIGTNSPGAELDIGGGVASNLQAIFTRGGSDNNFRLTAYNGSGTTTNSEHAWFGMDRNGSKLAGISFVRGGGANAWMNFQTGTGSNAMTIDNSGLVGIGTTTPSSALDIFSKVHITSGGTIYNTDNSRYLDMTGTLTDSLKISGNVYTTAGLFKSDAAGSNYMLGSLGIGTNNPGAKLDIQGGNLYVGSNANSNGQQYKMNVYSYDNNGQQIGTLGADYSDSMRTIRLYGSANTSQIKIDSSASNGNIILYPGTGKVGIGTTNPLARLSLVASGASEMAGTAHSSVLRLSGGALGGSIGNELLLSSTGYTTGNSVSLGVRGYRFANGSDYVTAGIIMGLDVDNTARNNNSYIALSPSGAIGIGSTIPDAKLNVNGTFHVTGALNSVVLDKLTGTGNRIVMTDASGSIYATSSSIATGLPSGTAGQTLRSDGTNWLANSVLYNNGTYIGIGTTAPRATLEVAANDGVNASIVAGNIIEVAGLSDVAQGADITITGGTLVSGGPTAKNGKGYWDITSFPSTITFNTRGWWTYAGISFTAANVHNYPAGGGAKLPANFLVEASADGTTWVTVEDVTGYTSALYYKNNVYGGSGKYIRITATAPQSGETTAKIANVQITNTSRAGKNPFSLSAEGSAVFLGGNVGLSNNNPGSLLTVSSGSNALNFTSGGTFYNSDNSKWLRFDNLITDSLKVQGNIYTTGGLFKSDGAGKNYMLGSLGVGTNDPQNKLDVTGGSARIYTGNRGFILSAAANTSGLAFLNYGVRHAGIFSDGSDIWWGNASTNENNSDVWTKLGVLTSSGAVGIATTTPDAKLNVNGTFHVAGALNTVTIDNFKTTGAGTVMADAAGTLYISQASGIGRYRAATAATYNGNQGGYTAANGYCNTASSGSHVCTTAEILNTINSGYSADFPIATLWINNGPPGYKANANDCIGWTSSTAGDYGTVWIKTAAGDGFGSLQECSTTARAYACCK